MATGNLEMMGKAGMQIIERYPPPATVVKDEPVDQSDGVVV